MPLTRGQKALLHMAPATLGVDEATRKLVQRNLGGNESAAEMSYRGYLAVMAHWEDAGWRHQTLHRDHFRRMAMDNPVYRMRGKAKNLAKQIGWTDDRGLCDTDHLDAFVLRQTGGRIGRLRACDADDLNKVIEGLKVMAQRAADDTSPSSPAAQGGEDAAGKGVALALQPPRRRRNKARETDDVQESQEPPVA